MNAADSWVLASPVRIVFGAGQFANIAEHAKGERILLVTTAGFTKRGITERVAKLLGARLVATMDRVDPNPDIDALDREAALLRAAAPDMIVALGGGSAMDTAKALAIQLAAPAGWTLDKHFRADAPMAKERPLPIVAIPTTAGTGAEVTPFAAVWDYKATRKCSVSSDKIFPQVALLDPELTLNLPREVTMATALDAISQCIESIWNRKSNAISEAWALQGLRLGMPALEPALAKPDDLELRARLMQASLLSGLAISHTRTAIAHSMSYPVTAHFGVPHGIACSFTLPAILEYNAKEDDGRLARTAAALGFSDVGGLRDCLIAMLHETGAVAALKGYGATPQKMAVIAHEMITPGRADNNMRDVGPADVIALLQRTSELLDL